MAAPKPITIVGGGLAGLTLGLGLCQRRIPVVLWEARRYPYHRVCGEFLSGRGQLVLARLGALELFLRGGAVWASTAAFFLARSRSPARPLPAPALCLSRFRMDALLADQFQYQGGQLLQGQRWPADTFGEGIVRATGRRPDSAEGGGGWVGLKVHARNVPLAADLEMHALPDGYVGLCRLAGDTVNICGLVRRPPGARTWKPWDAILGATPQTHLAQRLARAVFDEESFCSVAGLGLRPHRASARAECCLGDALTMTPPVTGNGMSMALEAAELAIEPLTAYSEGKMSWDHAQRVVAERCDQAFARRLAWARWLQMLMGAATRHARLGALALRSAWLWRTLLAATR